jgi:nicotinate-nucleotide pyrophosphorylase (carboxylating)
VKFNTPEIRTLIRLALKEDAAYSNLTTRLLIDPNWTIDAAIISKHAGVIAGLPLAGMFFKALDPSIQYHPIVRDGQHVLAGDHLAVLRGKARSILSAERPALNALQHLSGIATYTHTQVQKLKGTRAKLYDTRKTLPGWRLLQKYAVRCGGALNQRMSLGDVIMIKENHLHVVRMAKSDWKNVLAHKKHRGRLPFLQMEVQTDHDLRDALQIKPQRILLDNLKPRTLKRMMRILRRQIPGVEIEFTGGVNPENLRSLAKLGPERISMGRLTHTVAAFDCSLDIMHVHA